MNQAQVRFGRLNRKTAALPAMHLIQTCCRPGIASLPAPGRLAPSRFALSWRDVADDHAQSKRLHPLERLIRTQRFKLARVRETSVSTRCPTFAFAPRGNAEGGRMQFIDEHALTLPRCMAARAQHAVVGRRCGQRF
jgi:hypothetical protein